MRDEPVEDRLFALAASELRTDRQRPGLWAKCFAAERGDAARAEAAYISERVRQLKAELADHVVDVKPVKPQSKPADVGWLKALGGVAGILGLLVLLMIASSRR